MSVKVTLEIGHEAILKHKPTPDGFTHDWELYVKGCDGKDISYFIEKVVFNLHESFPKPKRVIKEPPYVLKESGYAGFLLPIDIYLKNRDEPKKATFNYDLMLQANTSYRRAQKEKIIIGNPTDEFRRKLLRGGGELINTSLNNMDDKHKDLNDEKSQLLSKPKLGGDNSNSGTGKKHKHRPDESKASSTFANLFGTPITKTSNKVSPDSKNTKHSPNQLASKSSSSNKNQEKSFGKDKDKEKPEKSSSKHKHNSPYKDKELRKNNNNTAISESLAEKQRDGSVGKTSNSSNKKEKPHSKERERSREKNSSKKSSSSPKRSGSNSSSSLQQSIIPPPPSGISPTRNSTLAATNALDSNYVNNNSNNSSSSIIKNQTTQISNNNKVETIAAGGGSGTKKSKKDKKEKNHDKDHRERDKRDKDKSKELLHQHNTNSNPPTTATNNNKFSLERFELKTNSNSSIISKDKEYSLKDSNNKIQPPVTVSQQSQDGYPSTHRINTGETFPISTPSSTSSDRKHKHHKKKDKNKKDLKTDNVPNTNTVHKEKSEVRKRERNQDKLSSGGNKNFEYSKKSDDRAATAVQSGINTATTIKSNNVNNTGAGANPLSALIREMSDKESDDESSDIDNHTNNNANSNNLNHSPHTAIIAQTMPGSIDKSDLVNENSNHIVNINNNSNNNLTKSQKSKDKLTDNTTSSSGGNKVKNSRKRNALSANLMEPPSSANQTTTVKSAKRSTGGATSTSLIPMADDILNLPNNPSSSATVSIQQSTSYLNSSTNNNNNNIFDSDNIPQLPLDYMNELKELQHKIMTLKDNNDLQQVVELIAATGRYEITSKTFDFDLCVLDRLTVQRLQEFFATLS